MTDFVIVSFKRIPPEPYQNPINKVHADVTYAKVSNRFFNVKILEFKDEICDKNRH